MNVWMYDGTPYMSRLSARRAALEAGEYNFNLLKRRGEPNVLLVCDDEREKYGAVFVYYGDEILYSIHKYQIEEVRE